MDLVCRRSVSSYHSLQRFTGSRYISMSDPFFDFFESGRPLIEDERMFFASPKEYVRSPKVYFPQGGPLPSKELQHALRDRRSERDLSPDPLDIETLGRLFFWSAAST